MNENFKEQNKFGLALIQIIKDNINKKNKPIYNPVYMYGLSRNERYNIFFRYFNNDFNGKHTVKYISCDRITENEKLNFDAELVIIENLDYLENDTILQKIIYNELKDNLLRTDIQFIICSDKKIEDIKLEDHFKSKIKSGITIYLKN